MLRRLLGTRGILLTLWLVFLGTLVTSATPARAASTDAAPWAVSFVLSAPEAANLNEPSVEVRWLGETRTVILEPVEAPANEQVWQGTLSGDPIRLLPVRLHSRSSPSGPSVDLYTSVEVLTYGDQTLHFAMAENRTMAAHRVSGAGTLSTVAARDAERLSLSYMWAAMMVVGLIVLHRRSNNERDWPALALGRFEPLVWLLLAMAWTWPAALAGGDQYVGRHFDAPGTIWFLDAASRFWTTLVDPHTAWPDGAQYLDADSFTMLGLGVLLQWADPVRWHGWLQILGVASSAWAASAFARTVGATAPWNLLAGLGFAFSGLAANALLEGHVYHLLNPWMPLFGLWWWKTTGEQSSVRSGLLAGGAFVLTMLTTGYLAIAASFLAVGLFAEGLFRRRASILPGALACLAVVLPCGVAYVMLHSASVDVASSITDLQLQLGSLRLENTAGPTPELDRAAHSLALFLPGLCFALTLYAWPMLIQRPRWTVLLFVAAAALVLALGPVWHLGDAVLAAPLEWLWTHGRLRRLRFPIRLLWVTLLCGSVLAARVAAHQFRSRPELSWFILGAALIESFVVVGLPLRQQTHLASTPSAYSTSEGPVFELLPTYFTPSSELQSWLVAYTCLHQVGHGRPIDTDCVHVPISEGPELERRRWVGARLLEGDAEAVVERLRSEQFTALVTQPDLYSAGDWARIQETLAAVDPSPEESRDGGAYVRIYQLTPGGMVASPSTPPTPSTTMRFQLWSRSEISPQQQYFIRITEPSGAMAVNRLVDDSQRPGDRVADGVWSVEQPTPFAEESVLEVVQDYGDQMDVLWSGPLRPAADHDHRVFLEVPGQPVEPVVFGEEVASPAIDSQNSSVARFASFLLGLLAVLGLENARRQNRTAGFTRARRRQQR